MAFIPLSEELKTKGKSVSDVIGERVSKSGGALIQWGMLTFVANASLITIAPYLFVIYLVIMATWIISVIALNKEFKSIT
jgi:AAA family ATP:ADP antiporter